MSKGICTYCKVNSVKDSRSACCSRSCSSKLLWQDSNYRSKSRALKTPVEVVCKNCSTVFHVVKWEASKRKFCSLSCSSHFLMNHTVQGVVIKERIRSPEVRAKANATYATEEYKKNRSKISKEAYTVEMRDSARKLMKALSKRCRADPEWVKRSGDSAKKRILDGTFGGGMSGVDYKGKGFMPSKSTIHTRTGIIMRSGWEVTFANKLDEKGVSWEYEPQRFKTGLTCYTPDFKLGHNVYVDVKPSRRFVVQPELLKRFVGIKKFFNDNNMELFILDKKDFNSFLLNEIGKL